jgi:hypothetical protein
MSTHHFFRKTTVVSLLCLLTACTTSTNLSIASPVAPSQFSPAKKLNMYESSGYSEMNKLEGSIGIIQIRNKKAYFDQKRGKLLKPPGYFDELSPFHDGLAAVLKDGKYGFINERGKWAISPRFTSKSTVSDFHDGAAIVESNSQKRFINKQGKFFTHAFDLARPFHRGVSVVMVGKKYGVINKQGNFLIPPKFTEEPDRSFDNKHSGLLVKVNGQEQCITDQGLPAKKNDCEYPLRSAENTSPFKVINSAVYLRGKLLVGRRWDEVIQSYASDVDRSIYVYRVGEKWGLVHESGEIRTPPQFDVTHSNYISGLANTDTLTIMFGHTYFDNGLAQAKINGKYGFIDATGKFVIPPKFDDAAPFNFDPQITPARMGKKWGYIDRQGNFIIPPKFDQTFDFDRRFGSLAQFKLNNKYGFIDRSGKIVIPAQFDEIEDLNFGEARGVNNYYDNLPNEGLAPVRIGAKWGYINRRGIIQISAKFNKASRFQYGVASVEIGSKELHIDRQGKSLPF